MNTTKKLMTLLLLAWLTTFAAQANDEAEYDTYRITWAEVKAMFENHPDSLKTLINRVAQCDTAMSTQEILVAYMGNSFFGVSPFGESRDARTALKEKKIDQAMELMEEAIHRNPLSLANNHYYITCYFAKNPQINDDAVDADIILAAVRFNRLLSAIYESGDGSQRFPFKVTCVDDEYTFMRAGLNLPHPTNQSLTNDGHDMFKLPSHTSTLYSGQEIHFDATRILQLEQEMFSRP